MPLSLVVGRSLALMCHPVLAWRCLPSAGRVALISGYASLSYFTTLFTLFRLRG